MIDQEDQPVPIPLGVPPTPPSGELHMAIDVSTLSDSSQSVIAALAWIVFDPKDLGGCADKYFKTVDWDQPQRVYNWPTIQEWMLANGMARRAIVNLTQPVPLLAAVTSVVEAYNKNGCKAIWATRKVLNTIEDALRYSKKNLPWAPAQARDLSAVWAVASEQGDVVDLIRDQTEPEDVPLGNTAFIARAVRHLYQHRGGLATDIDFKV